MNESDHELSAIADGLIQGQLDVFEAMKARRDRHGSADEITAAFERYDDARRRLRLFVGDTTVVKLPGAGHVTTREVLQEALTGTTIIDRLRERAGVKGSLSFDQSELEDVAQNYLAWFNQYDYAHARLEGAVLVLDAGQIPDDLEYLIREIEDCYAFQQYVAVASLCRTALEVGLRHIYQTNRLDYPDSANSKYVRNRIWRTRSEDPYKRYLTDDRHLYSDLSLDDFSPKLDQMITRLCWLPRYSDTMMRDEKLREVLHDLRRKSNAYVHGNASEDSVAPVDLMKMLFRCLHVVHEIEPHTTPI